MGESSNTQKRKKENTEDDDPLDISRPSKRITHNQMENVIVQISVEAVTQLRRTPWGHEKIYVMG